MIKCLACHRKGVSSSHLDLFLHASTETPVLPDSISVQMANHKLITFDDEYRIRVLDAEKYEASQSFRDNCAVFDARVDSLKDMAQEYAQVFQKAAKSVEAEKLRAIGIRNRVAALREEREASKTECDSLKAEKLQTLDSLGEEAKSLQLVVDEQEAQLARLQGTATL